MTCPVIYFHNFLETKKIVLSDDDDDDGIFVHVLFFDLACPLHMMEIYEE